MLSSDVVNEIAKKYRVSCISILLAFVLYKKKVVAIPRSGKREHILENRQAINIKLSEEDYFLLDRTFPAPNHKTYLDIV